MSRPVGNGIVEIVDEKNDGKGFMCMDLIVFLGQEIDECGDRSWEFWHNRFEQAKSGNCVYRDRCSRYARTMSHLKNKPVQLKLF